MCGGAGIALLCGYRENMGQRFQSTWAVAGEPSRSVACGIPGRPDQGLNPSPLHSKVDSLPLGHQGSLY